MIGHESRIYLSGPAVRNIMMLAQPTFRGREAVGIFEVEKRWVAAK